MGLWRGWCSAIFLPLSMYKTVFCGYYYTSGSDFSHIFFCYPSIGCILCFLSLRAICPPLESRIAQGTVHNALGYSIIYQQASACISYWQTESTYRAYIPSLVLSCSSLPCFLLPHECICLSFYSLYVIFIDLI